MLRSINIEIFSTAIDLLTRRSAVTKIYIKTFAAVVVDSLTT